MAHRISFPKVKEAREALAAKALEIFELQMSIARDALAAQDFEQANKAVQFLLEHMPKDSDGLTVIDSSVDNVKQVEGKKGPSIQIGIALGGMPSHKQLEPAVIDIEPEEKE